MCSQFPQASHSCWVSLFVSFGSFCGHFLCALAMFSAKYNYSQEGEVFVLQISIFQPITVFIENRFSI